MFIILIKFHSFILGSGTELLYTNKDKDIAAKAFEVEKGVRVVFLPEVVSRKKEIISPLIKYALNYY